MINPTISQVVVAIGRENETGISLLGTGFAVGNNLLATTAHVSGPTDKNLRLLLPRTKSTNDYQDTTDTAVNTTPLKLAAYDPIRDIALLELEGSFTLPYGVSGSDSAPTGSPVVTIGFPHADHGRLVLTEQHSHVGARVILGDNGVKTKHLILNIQTRPGQSGSPVLSSNGLSVVGMVVGSYAPGLGGILLGNIDPQTLHQTTHAISAEYINELIP